jgi:hypothetical protein
MAELKTLANMLKEIRAAYPTWKASEDTARVWAVYLNDLDDDLLVASVRKFISSAEHAFPPSIPEIRAIAGQLVAEVNLLPSALEAWGEVCRAKKPSRTFMHCDPGIDPRGWLMVDDPPHAWSHPLVKTCAQRFGWPRFPSGENETADRAHFMRAYEEMLKNETARENRLPQISQYIESQRALLAEDRRAALETGEEREIQGQLSGLARRMR